MRYARPMRPTCLLAVSFLIQSSILGCSSTVEPDDAASALDTASPIDAATDDASADDAATNDAHVASDAAHVDTGSDAGPCVAAGACDPFDPTSCGAQACRPHASGTACEDVSASPAGLGMPCLHVNDCEPGLTCLTFAPEGPLCHRMCPAGSVGACDTGYVCTGTFGDACIDVCRPLPTPCDIYAQDCASATDTCTLVRNAETMMPYTGCRPAGTQDEGMPCGGLSGSCGHGLICVGGASATNCRQVCDPSLPTDPCPAPTACTGLATTWGVHYCVAP